MFGRLDHAEIDMSWAETQRRYGPLTDEQRVSLADMDHWINALIEDLEAEGR